MMATDRDRVREWTIDTVNRRIDEESERHLLRGSAAGEDQIQERIAALASEWEFERVL